MLLPGFSGAWHHPSGSTLRADASHLTITSKTDAAPRQVERDAVVRFGSFEQQAADRWSSSLDFGLGIVRGNNQLLRFTLAAGVDYKTPKYASGLRATSIFNEQSDAADTRRSTLDLTFDRVPNRWRLGSFASFEQDERRHLDLRSLAGISFGRKFLTSERRDPGIHAHWPRGPTPWRRAIPADSRPAPLQRRGLDGTGWSTPIFNRQLRKDLEVPDIPGDQNQVVDLGDRSDLPVDEARCLPLADQACALVSVPGSRTIVIR